MKLGIIGTDSFHTKAFVEIINKKKLFPNVCISHIFGLNRQETEAVLQQVHIENIVGHPSEIIGNVDGVMVVFRDGNLHLKYAKPFIEAKIPVWIDKPVTVSISDANELVQSANHYGGIVMGGSTFPYARFITKLKNELNNGNFGNILTAAIYYPADMASPYNGLHFYAPHAVEMALKLFGYDVKKVTASRISDQNITAILGYKDYNVVLNFITGAYQGQITIIGNQGMTVRDITACGIYEAGISAFVSAIAKKQQPYQYDILTKSVEVINSIYAAMK